MPQTPLDYADPNHSRSPAGIWISKWWWRIAVGAGVVVAALALLVLPVRQWTIWCDPVSGSVKTRTTWFGISAAPHYEVSPLESRLKAIEYTWPQTWKFMSRDHFTLFGRAVEWEDGEAPPIFSQRFGMNGYARSATSDELRHFADTMRFGTESEQRAAVKIAGDKAIDALMSNDGR